MQIGKELTRGPGRRRQPREWAVRRRPSRARRSRELLEGADMVFVTAGMGGGTGTGAAPVVARHRARAGRAHRRRRHQALHLRRQPAAARRRSRGSQELKAARRHAHHHPQPAAADDVVRTTPAAARRVPAGRRGAAQRRAGHLRSHPVPRVHQRRLRRREDHHGRAGPGAHGHRHAPRARSAPLRAMEQAISSPLLDDVSIDGARGLLINITAGRDITLQEINEADLHRAGGGATPRPTSSSARSSTRTRTTR